MFRVAGQYFFLLASPVAMTILFVAVGPALLAVAWLVFRGLRSAGAARFRAAVFLVLPGMLLAPLLLRDRRSQP